MSEASSIYICRVVLHCVLPECTANLSVASFWRCTTTTTIKKFSRSQRAGSAGQFKEEAVMI